MTRSGKNGYPGTFTPTQTFCPCTTFPSRANSLWTKPAITPATAPPAMISLRCYPGVVTLISDIISPSRHCRRWWPSGRRSIKPVVGCPGAVLPELGFKSTVAAEPPKVTSPRARDHEPGAFVVLASHRPLDLEQEAPFAPRKGSDDSLDGAVSQGAIGPLRLQPEVSRFENGTLLVQQRACPASGARAMPRNRLVSRPFAFTVSVERLLSGNADAFAAGTVTCG